MIENKEFRVGQIRLCKRTWNRYTVTEVNDDGSIVVKYWCSCHGFSHIVGDKYSVRFKTGFSEDRVLRDWLTIYQIDKGHEI